MTCHLLLVTAVNAEVLERIVAIVNDEIILLGEFEEAVQAAKAEATEREVLDEMINRILLLKEAKKFRMQKYTPGDDSAVIDEYINKRIKPFIHISFEKIESYYLTNKERFGNKDFYDVKDGIENNLIEQELNRKILDHTEELRKGSYIRIQLE